MIRGEEHRLAHLAADGVKRADRGLRVFGRRVGHAVMCPTCDGDGVVVGVRYCRPPGPNHYSAAEHRVTQPVTCETCGGEGLDPNVRQGEE